MKERIAIINQQLSGNIISDLAFLQKEFSRKIVFSTSFGLEDQLITYFIAQMTEPIEIFTLDTGRLFPEIYDVWESTRKKYGLKIKTYFPKAKKVEDLTSNKGVYSFYESLENRKECCFIRKVEPLQRGLSGNEVWVTGLRSEQSVNRAQMETLEWDEMNKIIKYQPLLNYSWENVWEQIRTFGIPYCSLHDKGYPSIGCQPCTRAIEEGEDLRAGRWWWENSKKECGLHQLKNT